MAHELAYQEPAVRRPPSVKNEEDPRNSFEMRTPY